MTILDPDPKERVRTTEKLEPGYLADAKCMRLFAKSILPVTILIFERQNSIDCIAIKTQVKSKLVILKMVVIVHIIISNISLYIY